MLKNSEPVIGTNYWKNGMKNQGNEKQCKNVLKILQVEWWYKVDIEEEKVVAYIIFTGIKFTNISSNQWANAIQPLAGRPCETAENYQILYAKFYFKNIPRKIATKFLSILVLKLTPENFISAKPIQKYLNKLQSYSIGCPLANCDTKDPIVM